MKIRPGFVSNSSSSSFIIAVRKDITKKDIDTIFKNNLADYYKTAVAEWKQYGEESYGEPAPDVNEVKSELFRLDGMELDQWFVTGGECSNDGNFIANLLYNTGGIDTEKFKFKHQY